MTESSSLLLLLIPVGLALLALVLWVSMANKLRQLSGQVNLTIGTLAAQYQQRFDLIPDVLRAAKMAVKSQRDYFDKMLEIRKGMHPGVTAVDLGNVPPDLAPIMLASASAAAGKPVNESNPVMSVEAFTELQRIMKDTEKDVTAARRFYCAAVAEYNTAVRSFPLAVVAGLHGHRPIPYAKITKELETKPDYFKKPSKVAPRSGSGTNPPISSRRNGLTGPS